MTRVIRRIVAAGAYTLLALLLLVAIAAVAIQTPLFKEWARGLAERQATRLLNGEVTIGRLEGNLWTGAELSDVRIRQDGREVVTIERATARYNPRRLLDTDLALADVTLTRPVIVLVHDEAGWRVGRLLKRRPENPRSTRTFEIESLNVADGVLTIEDSAPAGPRLPERFTALDSSLNLRAGGGRIDLDIGRATFQTEEPAIAVHALSGRFANGGGLLQLERFRVVTAGSAIDLDGRLVRADGRGRIQARVAASPLHVDEFAAYLPALAGRGLVPTLSAAVDGPLEALGITAEITDPHAGSIRSQITLDLEAPVRRLRGAIAVERLNLASFFGDTVPPSRLTATTNADLAFDSPLSSDSWSGRLLVHSTASDVWGYRYERVDGRVDIRGQQLAIATTVDAYGANARVTGSLKTGESVLAYDLRGLVRNVDLRRLPPQLNLPTLDTRIAGAYTAKGAGRAFGGTLAFDTSVVEGATIDSGSQGRFTLAAHPAYGFSGRISDLDLARVGRALAVDALGHHRYASRLTGRIDLDGAGRDLATLRIDATADLEPSIIFDTTLGNATVEAHVADRELRTSTAGAFASLNLASLTGRSRLDGDVAGSFDVRAVVSALGTAPGPDTVSLEGTMRLTPSTIGPLTLDEATLEGRYANRGGEVTALHIVGPDIEVTASGPLMLGDEGDSALEYRIVHGRLDALGPLVERDIAGRLRLDGVVAGNGARMTSQGTATVAGLRVDTSFDALEVESTFDVSLDDLRPQTLSVSADVESTLLTVAGRSFRALTAGLEYADSALRFEATVREELRVVTGAGQLRVLADAREVRVDRLTLDAGGVTWNNATGTGFTARYGANGLLTLDGVMLTSGAQRLTLGGSISLSPGVDGTLDARFEQVDLKSLGTVLLVQRPLGGVLNGSGQVTGDSDHRLFSGSVAVADGLVNTFAFQSLEADLTWDRGRLGVDATLIQMPGAQLVVNGELATSTEGAAANEPMSLAIKTEGIDLAVLGATTTGLDGVSGRLLADLHVGGTAAAPLVEGLLHVQEGAFTVAATGTAYAGAAIEVAFLGDRLRIERLHILDDNGKALNGSGSLSVLGRQVQDIDLTLEAREFKVLNNELGELSVNTTLDVYGTLLSPKVAGLVRIHAGRLEVDALVERFTSNAYAVQAAGEPAPAAEVEPAPDTGATFDVVVEVPGNLVLRGSDIRPADAAVALGDLAVTVGGDFTVRKTPGTDPVLLGTVTTVRGTYDFQGRRFDILRNGTIAFRGDRPIDPALNLQAERVISGIVAHVNIDGTMRRPEVTLSSRPPLDEADILSLVIFNQPVNRLGESQRNALGERALGLATGFVVSPISDTLEHALDIDLFEIDTSFDEGLGPAITIGEQVGERLFARFTQRFGAQDSSEFQLEYQLSDFLRLQGSFAEGLGRANRSLARRVERAGIDLVVFFSY